MSLLRVIVLLLTLSLLSHAKTVNLVYNEGSPPQLLKADDVNPGDTSERVNRFVARRSVVGWRSDPKCESTSLRAARERFAFSRSPTLPAQCSAPTASPQSVRSVNGLPSSRWLCACALTTFFQLVARSTSRQRSPTTRPQPSSTTALCSPTLPSTSTRPSTAPSSIRSSSSRPSRQRRRPRLRPRPSRRQHPRPSPRRRPRPSRPLHRRLHRRRHPRQLRRPCRRRILRARRKIHC